MKIILHGFYISMSINVADIGSVYTAIFTFYNARHEDWQTNTRHLYPSPDILH